LCTDVHGGQCPNLQLPQEEASVPDDLTINPGAELRYGMTMVTASHQYLTGQLSPAQYAEVIEAATADLAPQGPADLMRPVLSIALRLARMYAEATGTDVETALEFVGQAAALVPEGRIGGE
jgi:hypothetical protein